MELYHRFRTKHEGVSLNAAKVTDVPSLATSRQHDVAESWPCLLISRSYFRSQLANSHLSRPANGSTTTKPQGSGVTTRRRFFFPFFTGLTCVFFCQGHSPVLLTVTVQKTSEPQSGSALLSQWRSAPRRLVFNTRSSAQLRPPTKQPPSGTRAVCVWCQSETGLPQHHLVNKSTTYPGMQRGAVKHRHDAPPPRPPPYRKGQKYIDSKKRSSTLSILAVLTLKCFWLSSVD